MKNKKIQLFSFKNIFLNSTIITIVTLVILYLTSKSPFFGDYVTKLNLSFMDTLFTSSSSAIMKPSKEILVVEIDDKTLRDKELGGLGRWQEFKREYYKTVIENLNSDGAIVIGLDVIFSEKSQNSEDDKILAEGLKKAGNIVLAYQYGRGIYPSKIFTEFSEIGDVYPIVSKINKTVYSIFPFYDNFENKAFSISVLNKYYSILKGEKTEFKSYKEGFSFSDKFINYSKILTQNDRPEILINYLKDHDDFNKASFVDIYNKKYNPQIVKDKIILIGASATALHDEYNTPEGTIPGVYMHANVINTILKDKMLTYFYERFELMILILFTYGITILGMFDKKKYYFVSSLIILGILFIWTYRQLYTNYDSILNYPIYFLISILFSFILVNIYRYLNEDKGKKVLKGALSQYLAEDLVKKVLDNYEEIKLSGEKRENTIFFSDIAGFTTISENMDAEELVKFLREYLEKVSDVIIEKKGFINKYEGDAVMALWGAFGDNPEQAKLACIASIEQQKVIDNLNITFKEKYNFTISARMGINKGQVIVGNIGSEGKKMEFTALGDNVNLASRLEGINKFYNTLICVSESVKESVGNDFVFRKLDKIKVKGKSNSVIIFELVGYRNEVIQEKLDNLKKFENALDLYWNRKFVESKKILLELCELQDNVAPVLLDRCDYFIKNPPKDDWDGSREFTEK